MSAGISNNYGRIVKSSSLVGGSEMVRLAIGVIQVKFVAILLGPLGVGLAGTYESLINLVQQVAGLGIASSGVREVAHAVGTGDDLQIGRTVLTLRRICWLTGIGGALFVALLARPLSQMTFGSAQHAWALIVLAWIVLLASIRSAQMCHIQGTRRIADLARLKIVGAVGGAAIGIGFYAWLRLDGIVPALVTLAAFELAASWWYARKVPAPKAAMSWKESVQMSGGFLRLGLAFMWSGLLAAAVAYVTRLLIMRELDLQSVGIFQSAFRLSAMFVGFILQAMGADFYPHLTAVSSDHGKMNRLVNEQTEVAVLLAVPGLLATLILAPWIIRIFYTAQFARSADLLQWFVLGCLGQVISWPMGYILLAKGASRVYIFTETVTHCVHIALMWTGLKLIGIEGVAIAFFALYVLYTILMLVVTQQLVGFTWNAEVRRMLFSLVAIVVGGFAAARLLPEVHATVLGSIATLVVSIYCLRELIRRIGPQHRISRAIRSLGVFGRVLGQGIG